MTTEDKNLSQIGLALVLLVLAILTSGNSARATITLCTENGGGGQCEERTPDSTVP